MSGSFALGQGVNILIEGGGEVQVEVEGDAAGGAIFRLNGVVVDAAGQRGGAQEEDDEATLDEVIAELEPVFDEVTEQLTGRRDEFEKAELEREIDRAAGELDLDDDQQAKLGEAVEEAVAASRPAWKQAFPSELEGLARVYGQRLRGSSREAKIERRCRNLIGQARRDGAYVLVPDEARPQATEIWRRTLEETLTGEQLEGWEARLEAESAQEAEKVDAVVERTVDHVKGDMRKRLSPVAERIRGVLILSADRADALAERVETIIEERGKVVAEVAREQFAASPESLKAQLLKRNGRISLPDEVEKQRPEQGEDWTIAIAELLDEEELEQWNEAEAAHLAEEAKEEEKLVNDIVRISAQRYRGRYEKPVNDEVEEILSSVELTPEKKKELEEAAEAVVEEVMASWRKRARQHLDGLEEDAREQQLRRGYISLDSNAVQEPLERESWKEALETILTASERNAWKRAAQAREDLKLAAMSNGAMVALHRYLHFTPEQVEDLGPVFDEMVKTTLGQYLKRNSFYLNFSTVCRGLGRKEIDDQLSEILLPEQQAWLDVLEAMFSGRNRRMDLSKETDLAKVNVEEATPDQVEQFLAIFISRRMEQWREAAVIPYLSEIEAMDRAGDLSERERQLLSVAGKGAAEAQLQDNATNLASSIRNVLERGRNRGSLQDRFNSFGYSHAGRKDEEAEDLWARTIEEVLSSENGAAWAEYQNERQKWERAAVAQFTLARLDSVLSLSEKQREVLLPEITKVIADYGPDLEKRVSQPANPWFFNGWNALLPVQGISNETFEEILTEKQQTSWRDSYRRRLQGQWDYVRRLREERLQGSDGSSPEDDPAGA